MDFSLLNVRLRFDTQNSELSDFLRHHSDIVIDKPGDSQPDICVTLKEDKWQLDKKAIRVSRNIWIGESSVFISEIERFPGLKISARVENYALHIDAFFQNKDISLPGRILMFLKPNTRYKEVLYIGLYYYLILMPLFYYLEHFNQTFLLHASSVAINGNGIILSGLGGIGKSTFSLGTLALKDSRFLSDNLIFFDDKKIYSCPEPIALDNNSLDMLHNIKDKLLPQDIEYSHGRKWYQLKSDATTSESAASHLFWLQWGNEVNVVPIQKDICINNLLNINLLAKEIREYSILSAAFNLGLPSLIHPNTKYDVLSNLLSTVHCYALQIKPKGDINTAILETIGQIL